MTDFQLQTSSKLPKGDGPTLVCILDGWGENVSKDAFNAVFSAKTPTMDGLAAIKNRWRTIRAHGTAVGLPSDDDMGNSEVGHNALGAGQVINQGAALVDKALEDGSLFTSEGWNHVASNLNSGGTLHLIGLLSDGGVHSRTDQLFGIIRGAVERGTKKLRVHILTDGRDVPDGSSLGFINELEDVLKEVSASCDAKIASGGGRMGVTMDRYEADWNIVKRGWDAHVLGEAGDNKFTDAHTAVKTLRKEESDSPVSDQWLEPFVIVDEAGAPVGTVQDGDSVVIFNFRADRVIELSKAFEYTEFSHFDRVRCPNVKFAGIMQYDGDLKLPANYLVPPPAISGTSGEYLAKNGLKTFVCSETQKFGHVTFFWNGNRSGYFDSDLETYLEIPSDNCPFNEKPDMKAREICEAGKVALRSGKYDQVRINFANPDMVGHTGDLAATTHCCELVDTCVKELLDVVDEVKGRFLITADHGNADDMVQRAKKTLEPLKDEDGKPVPLTSHTLAPVPVAIGGAGLPDDVHFKEGFEEAGLGNVAATFLNLMGYEAPSHMQPSLIA